MKIGLLLPSIIASKRFENLIFAPRDLFVSLVNGLVDKGHEVTAFAPKSLPVRGTHIPGNSLLEEKDFQSVKDLLKEANIAEALKIKMSSEEYELDLARTSIQYAKEHKLDIIHAYLSYPSMYALSLSPVPVVFTIHDPFPDENTLEFVRMQRFTTCNFIAISQRQKQQYEERLSMKNVSLIYHGTPLPDPANFTQNRDDYLVFLGRYIPQKGPHEAIQASIKTNKPLKIASSKNYQKIDYYEQQIKPYISNPVIQELGYLTHAHEKNSLLAGARALLFPSRWEEPFGMIIIEALAVGTPVIAYNQGSVTEIIKDGETGFIVDSSAGVDGLTRAIEKIYSMSDEEYSAMRKKCRRHVEENFSVEKMVEAHEQVYSQLIGAKSQLNRG